MLQIMIRPDIHVCADSRSFAEQFGLGARDLVFTNRCIYEPFFGRLEIRPQLPFQEDFGAGEPTDIMLDAVLGRIRSLSFDRIVAIGGGTVLDMAKILGIARPGERFADIAARPLPDKSEKTVILVPTTCGTGSEVTNIAIVNHTALQVKKGLVCNGMYASAAVLVPELLRFLPYKVFATSSLDALVHAVESFLSPNATMYSRMFSEKALSMIIAGYRTMVEKGVAPSELMGDFLMAANCAGIAFGTAGCGAVHAMSYPLGATHHIPHGESNYSVFMGVLDCYRQSGGTSMDELERALAASLDVEPARALETLGELLLHVLPLKPLHEYGMKREECAAFAGTVMETQQRLLRNVPVPMTVEDMTRVYEKLF